MFDKERYRIELCDGDDFFCVVNTEEEIKRLKKELEEALKEVDELQTTIDSMSCLHSSPAYDPQTADEALNWINEDRGYGSWSSTDSRRNGEGVYFGPKQDCEDWLDEEDNA